MANYEQLNIFYEGVEAWNKWQDENRDDFDIEIDLSGEDLSDQDLSEVDFSRTNLSCVNFSRSILKWAFFHQAKFDRTIFGSTDLSETLYLESAYHKGPSIIDIETIYQSKGNLPIKFLRGCGLSDLQIETSKLASPGLDANQVTDITYKIHEMYSGRSIQYYSCFISYSSKDQAFAQQLHDDLQNNGVRCWFDREDLKIGDPLRLTIDHQIRLRDKLLVIISENSLTSEWVGDEVESALEEESKNNRLVLFPIRLDDAVLNTREDWAAKIKRRRHIGDFSRWQDRSKYQKAFERLLRDLKSSEGLSNGE